MALSMKPIPTTDSAWLDEVRHAFADASEALPFMELLGNKAGPASIFTIAPNLCAKFRGLPASGQEFDRAKEMALASYVASSDTHAEVFAFPEVAFAFCYVASHLGYGLISKDDAARLLDHFLAHSDRLLTPPDARLPQRKHRPATKDTPKLEELLRLIAGFCEAHLNQEYGELCARLARKAGRKRTPPFATGQLESWAAGIVHAICTVNFAFDKSQKPHVTSPCIANFFGVSLNTASAKSKTLRDLFRLRHWDSEFGTEEMQKRNPLRMLGIL